MVSMPGAGGGTGTNPVRGLKLPPAGFNPWTASMSALNTYDFPVMPDPRLQPGLYQLFSALFTPPVTFVDPRCISRHGARSHRRRHRAGFGAVGGAFASSHIATSRSWSGASIVPSGGRQFVLVGGVWTVPIPGLPPEQWQVPGGASYVCSTWVGLDGQHRYLNSSLPQIGTMQTLASDGTSNALAFFQWWDNQDYGEFRVLDGLAVAPGDTIAGLLWVRTPTSVVGYLRNLRTNEMTTVEADAPSVRPDGGPEVQLIVTGANAEWVLERPTEFDTDQLCAFPDYGTATFSSCCAGAAEKPGSLQAVQERDLTAAELLRLFDVRPDGAHTAFLSMPERVSNAGLHLRYGSFM